MYGIILRLDAGRQARVGKEPLEKLLGKETYKKVKEQRRGLNASQDYSNPFAPTLVRPSLYPDYFRGTGVQTLFWKIKNFNDMHELEQIQIDNEGKVTFTFSSAVDQALSDRLDALLKVCGHPELESPSISGKKLVYVPRSAFYSAVKE